MTDMMEAALAFKNFWQYHSDEFNNEEEALEVFLELLEENPDIIEDYAGFEDQVLEAMEEASFFTSKEERLQVLKEDLDLDPSNLDIHLEIILLEEDDIDNIIVRLEELEKSYKKSHKRSLKDGYTSLENRPYFTLRYYLICFMFDALYFKEATSHARDLLRMDPRDPLGLRFILMAIYTLSHDHKSARTLFKSREDFRHDDRMLVAMITSLILERDMDYAKSLVSDLVDLNPSILDFFADFENHFAFHNYWPIGDSYRLNSIESLWGAFDFLIPIYCEYVPEPKQTFLVFRRLIEETHPGALDTRQKELEKDRKEGEEYERAHASFLAKAKDTGLFKGIRTQSLTALFDAGLVDKESLGQISEDEFLSIYGLGEVTLKKLKDNGASFLEK